MTIALATVQAAFTFRLGDELEVAAPAGATVLQLGDTGDFSESGGTLFLGGSVRSYDSSDDDAATITLSTPLTSSLPIDTDVYVYPFGYRKVATVEIEDNEEPDEADVPQRLWDKIPDGVRPENQQEIVVLEMDASGDWVVREIDGQQPEIDGSLVALRNGTIPVFDEDGTLRTVIGLQDDGEYTVVDVHADPPPAPLAPLVTAVGNGATVYWDGTFDPPTATPSNFTRVTIHAAPLAGFPGYDPEDQTQIMGSITERTGGERTLALPAGVDHIVYLVAWNSADKYSLPSDPAVVTPAAIQPEIPQDILDRIDESTTIHRTPEPPWPNGSVQPQRVINDEWHDTNNGNLAHVWDGSNWNPMPIGGAATDADILADKIVPVGTATELQWGVPDPTAAPAASSSAFSEYLIPPASNGVVRAKLNAVHREADGTFWGFYPSNADPKVLEVHRWTSSSQTRTLVGTLNWDDLWPSVSDEFTTRDVSAIVLGNDIFLKLDYLDSVQVFSKTNLARKADVPVSTSGLTGDNNFTHQVVADADGVNFWVVCQHGTSSAPLVSMRKYSPAGVLSTTRSLATVATPGAPSYLTTTNQGLVSTFGTGVYYFAFWNSSNVYFFNLGTGAYDSAMTIAAPSTGNRANAFIWDGTNFLFPDYSVTSGESDTEWLATINQGLTTSLSIRIRYTFADTYAAGTGLHESAPSPIRTYTVPARSAVNISGTSLPRGIDADQPDCYYVYISVDNGPWYRQKPRYPTDSVNPYRIVEPFTAVQFIPPFETTTPQAPTVSNFPQGQSGIFRAETGGFIVKGDSTGDWPHLRTTIQTANDSRYSFAGHNHDSSYAPYTHTHSGYTTDSEYAAEVTARANADAALDTRIDALEAEGKWMAGDVKWSARSSATMTGWIECLGQFVSRTTYAALFSAIGHAFNGGVDPGNGTFRLPEGRDRSPVGASASKPVGQYGGAASVVLGTSNLPQHSHDAGTLATGGSGEHRHGVPRKGNVGTGTGYAQGNNNSVANDDTGLGGDHTHSITGITGAYGLASPAAVSVQDPYTALRLFIKI